MELEGLGWSELLKSLVISPIPVLLWSVRENLLGEVMHKWDISPEHLIGIDKMEVAQAADLISRIIKTHRELTQNQ